MNLERKSVRLVLLAVSGEDVQLINLFLIRYLRDNEGRRALGIADVV